MHVLPECPAAQSIGKTVLDKGYLFVWDPREKVPYLFAAKDRKRCNIRVPRNARICASRVVEYVPQYDEVVQPKPFDPMERLRPVTVDAAPAEPDAGGIVPEGDPRRSEGDAAHDELADAV